MLCWIRQILQGLHYVPLQQMLSWEKLGMPVQIDHDAKAACLGEYYYGAGRGELRITLYVGDVLAASAFILKRPNYCAAKTMLPVRSVTSLWMGDGDLCSCGSHGCFETFIAGPWLVRRYLNKNRSCWVRSFPLAWQK